MTPAPATPACPVSGPLSTHTADPLPGCSAHPAICEIYPTAFRVQGLAGQDGEGAWVGPAWGCSPGS